MYGIFSDWSLYNKHSPMADMTLPQKGGRRKVQAPRIDLTPMVDLGFLLITFFMFTTTLAQHKALTLNMPTREISAHPSTIPEESTLTMMPVKDHKVVYYKGAPNTRSLPKQCHVSNVTDIVLAMKQTVAMQPAHLSAAAHKLHVLIKPGDDCKYEDVVHLLDAMLIADVPYYAILDLTDTDRMLIEKSRI